MCCGNGLYHGIAKLLECKYACYTTGERYDQLLSELYPPPVAGGYVAAANVRSTLDIVWSCLSILFLCSWSILHLNIPAQYTPQTKSQWIRRSLWLTWRKVKWMLWTLVAPELIFGKAVVSIRSARTNHPRLKSVADVDEVPWSLAHTFLADMGGFVIYFPEDMPLPRDSGENSSDNADSVFAQQSRPLSGHNPTDTSGPQHSDISSDEDMSFEQRMPFESTEIELDSLQTSQATRTRTCGEDGVAPLPTPLPLLHQGSGQLTRANVIEGPTELDAMQLHEGYQSSEIGVPPRAEPWEVTTEVSRDRASSAPSIFYIWDDEEEEFRLNQVNASNAFGATTWKFHSYNETVVQAILPTTCNPTHAAKLMKMKCNLWVLSAAQLHYARSCGIVSKLHNITEDELSDKGKGDFVAKTLAILQVIWLIAQLSVRAIHQKPISPLEIATLCENAQNDTCKSSPDWT
ncbi:hypothetical protein PG995_014777 [Apiospora arundinis]